MAHTSRAREGRLAVETRKLKHFAGQYAKGKVSAGQAAKQAGVSLWEMMAFLRSNKVPAQYDMKDLEHDLETLERETIV